jgi:hypothetical protein
MTLKMQTDQLKKKWSQPSIAALFSRQSSVEKISLPVESAPTVPMDPLPLPEPTKTADIDTRTSTTDEDENIEGMSLNPHWIANNGKRPENWRYFSALQKYHTTEMKCFRFDVASGGRVKCCCTTSLFYGNSRGFI